MRRDKIIEAMAVAMAAAEMKDKSGVFPLQMWLERASIALDTLDAIEAEERPKIAAVDALAHQVSDQYASLVKRVQGLERTATDHTNRLDTMAISDRFLSEKITKISGDVQHVESAVTTAIESVSDRVVSVERVAHQPYNFGALIERIEALESRTNDCNRQLIDGELVERLMTLESRQRDHHRRIDALAGLAHEPEALSEVGARLLALEETDKLQASKIDGIGNRCGIRLLALETQAVGIRSRIEALEGDGKIWHKDLLRRIEALERFRGQFTTALKDPL